SFAKAFVKHESRYKDDVEGMQKVQGWRNFLTATANIKGYDIHEGIESESDCSKRILDQISFKCKTSVSYFHKFVGRGAQLNKVESQLKMEIDDAWILWIWEWGASRLRFKKVLVVLDDIDHRDQLDYLAKELVWLGNCGRIIATTRYKHLIGENL
ncbi:hypothetical protein H5410_061959, partial [Solanum commersonii]